MKTIQIIFILFIFQLSLQAQEFTQTVRGQLRDSDSEHPLFGATIVVLDTDPFIGTTSDAEGYYRLTGLPVGRYNLRIRMLGYEEQVIPNVQVGSGKEVIINVVMRESFVQMNEVVITDESLNKAEVRNEMASVSARAFSVEETKRYAGALNDPGRMALSFAGVTANNDMSNEIVVRGNSPRGLLWRMEGVEIPNPNHFSNVGSAGGAISMLSNNMMANSDFFTGAFPSEFGNAMGGVFDIRLRKGNNEKRETALQIGVIGTDVALEGPIKKGYKGSYLINYRYSSLALLQKAGLAIVGDAVPKFQDLSYSIFLPTKRFGNFSLFGIGGISLIDQEYPGKTYVGKSNFRTSLGVGGLTHGYTFGDKALLKTVIAYTGTTNRYLEKEFDTNNVFRRDIFDERFLNEAIRGSSTLTYKLNKSQTIKAGLIYSLLNYDMQAQYYNRDLSLMESILDAKGNSSSVQSYVNWRSRLTERITLNGGVHYTRFMLNGNQSIEPRAGLSYAMDDRQRFSAGFGLHSRMEDPSFYMFQKVNSGGETVQLNRNVDFSKARHFVLGYERLLTEHVNVKAEVYYQALYNIPVAKHEKNSMSAINMEAGFAGVAAVNEGTGRNMGLDITMEKFFHRGYFFLVTTSLFDSRYTGSDGVERNTTFNGKYAGNVLAGKEFSMGKNDKNQLLISMRLVGAGGRYFSPVLLNKSIEAGRMIFDETRAYSIKSDDYFRADFQLSYTINKSKHASVWKMDIQNVTNRQNMYARYYDVDSQSLKTALQGGIIPTISYRLEF